MNRLFTILTLALLTALPALATETGDTLVIEKPQKIKIETRDTVQRIVISGMEGDPYFNYMQRISIPDTAAVRRKFSNLKDFNRVRVVVDDSVHRSSVDVSAHIMLGLNMMTQGPDAYEPRLLQSFGYTFMLSVDWHPFGKRNVWSVGLGMGFNDYRQRATHYWQRTEGQPLALQPYTDEQSHTKTSLSVTSIQVPVTYTHFFDARRRWGAKVGGIVNFNTGSHATRQFTYLDEDYKVQTGSIGQRPVTVDALLVLKTPYFLPLYVKYSPTTFFKSGAGPKMHQLSFGIYL